MITNGRDGAAQRSSDEHRDAAPVALAEGLGTRLGPAATFATTEHFNLQTARATTVSEANGRASIYLAALSSNLIALAFIGQMSRLGTAFYAFALILLPVLAFVGAVTFVRLVQSSNVKAGRNSGPVAPGESGPRRRGRDGRPSSGGGESIDSSRRLATACGGAALTYRSERSPSRSSEA